MRLDKFLSDAASCSRREIKGLVRAGAVTVNGKTALSADMQVARDSLVTLKGKQIVYKKYIYLMLNKPQGYISSTESDRNPAVTELVPEEWKHFKVFPVGRLDKDTEGLLLLTNDGRFDHAIMSPRRNMFKRYFARLSEPAVAEDVEVFAAGMEFADFTAKPAKLEITENPSEVFVSISEGKYHQVKRMWEKTGKSVVYLKRTAIGELLLDESLPSGKVRELTVEEMRLLGMDNLLEEE